MVNSPPIIIRNAAGLIMPALNAGMKVPDSIFDYDGYVFKHFSFFCGVQLNYRMAVPYLEWHNAVVVAKLTYYQMDSATWDFLVSRGFKRGEYV